MKKTFLLSSIAALTVGTLALVVGQDKEEPKETDKAPPTPPSGTETVEKAAPTSLSGIRTNAVVMKRLPGSEEDAITVPVASVFVEEDAYFVLAKDDDSDGDFRQVKVSIGRTNGNLVEVTEGLSTEDQVLMVTMMQVRFPAFGDETFASCEDSCQTVCSGDSCKDAAATKCNLGECPTAGTACTTDAKCETSCDGKEAFGFTLSAKEFFDSVFAPAPGTVMMGGPGFCPPF